MSDTFWIQFFGSVIAIVVGLPSIIAAIYAVKNKRQGEVIHDLVNSQSAKLNKLTGEAEHAKGKLEGAQEEKDKSDG